MSGERTPSFRVSRTMTRTVPPRRTNEDNVDLNRNFRDFSVTLPGSDAYEHLHECLVPERWGRAGACQRWPSPASAYEATRDADQAQAAVSGGQYTASQKSGAARRRYVAIQFPSSSIFSL